MLIKSDLNGYASTGNTENKLDLDGLEIIAELMNRLHRGW